MFYEVLELDYEVFDQDDLDSYPPFIFDVYDYDDDFFDSTPDFLGRALIEPKDSIILKQQDFEDKIHSAQSDVNFEIPDTPKWHPIRFRPGEPKCGEVLVSFCVVEHDYQFVN